MDNVSTTAERKLMAKAIVEGIKAYYNDTSSTSTSSASSSTSSSSASTSTSTSTTTSSSSKPAYVSRGYLQKGDVDRGSYKQIKSLEIKLKKMGLYKGAIDGDFGSGVDSGVRKFQKIFGLTVDGKFGSKSKAMLNKLWAYRGILKQGSQGTYVKYLQLLLNGTGAGLTVDGQFGTLTGNAVYNLQKANGLTVDRIAGNQTFTTLIK
jgi:peptidoglycan hydrolase-like protein with peptidoglycan-binding domain